jgi:hypothetical protein
MRLSAPTILRIAALALTLLSLARAAGGVTLLLQGREALQTIDASEATAQGVGLGLLVVSLFGLIAAVLVARLHPAALVVASLALLAFVADGLVNGALLFGRPTDAGTLANAVIASSIGLTLSAGKLRTASERKHQAAGDQRGGAA